MRKKNNSDSIFCHPEYSGFLQPLGYNENSSGSMRKLILIFSHWDCKFRNGNEILDYSEAVVLEPKEFEVFNVNFI